MDQQHPFNPATEHPDTRAGEAGLPEAPGTSAPTVLAEGEWLAVSTEGFSEQQRGRPLEHLVKELVQNALDSVGGSGRIDLDTQPAGPRRATVRCADDGPGADDLSRLNVVFVTGKKDGVTQRGRMGRGFKEMLSIASYATVRSRDQELCFTVGGDGVRRVTHRRGLHPHPGFEAVIQVEHDEAGKDLSGYFRSFLLPPGVVLAVNGVPVPPRPVHKTVEARLTTERFAHGRWEKPVLATRVHLVATADGEQPLIHEMGIPVCDVEWSEPFHVDVGQRVPMNPNRDAVQAGYPARLHKACLPALLPEMTTERVLASWVGEAAQSAGDAVQKAVVAKAFGEGAVRAVPATGRFDHNADAEELGSTVVHSAHMTGGFRKLLQQQVPTAAAVAKEAMRRRAETAVEAGLDRAEVAALDLTADGADASDATRAIVRLGREAVLARMDFARWFAEAVVECRYGEPRAVPVQVAHPERYAATWSIDGVLTLSLADEAFWQGPFGRGSFELVLHELAHHEAFHHGRSFPREVEAHAGAAAEVMLTRADEAKRLFPELLPASPSTAPAASGERPVPGDPGRDGTGEAGRPGPPGCSGCGSGYRAGASLRMLWQRQRTHTADQPQPTGPRRGHHPGRRELQGKFLPPAHDHRDIQRKVSMAIYHLRFGLVQRAKGQSAVAVAADRARVRLHDQRLDRMQAPLPAKRGTMPILSRVLLPDGAPARWHNREVLWNEVEACGRRRDACLAREVEFALPAELLPYQAAALARDYAQVAFVSEGMAADLNVHWALRPDGQPKPYAQVLLTMRRIEAGGFGLKERAWNDRANALRWRQLWAVMANICLAAHGHAARIDHRSYAEQGIALEPQNKIGPNAARRAARGEPSERMDENRAIAHRNAERAAGRAAGKQS